MNKPLRARRLGTGSEEHQYFVLSYRLKLVVLQPRSSFKLLMVRHHSDWCLLAGGASVLPHAWFLAPMHPFSEAGEKTLRDFSSFEPS